MQLLHGRIVRSDESLFRQGIVSAAVLQQFLQRSLMATGRGSLCQGSLVHQQQHAGHVDSADSRTACSLGTIVRPLRPCSITHCRSNRTAVPHVPPRLEEQVNTADLPLMHASPDGPITHHRRGCAQATHMGQWTCLEKSTAATKGRCFAQVQLEMLVIEQHIAYAVYWSYKHLQGG